MTIFYFTGQIELYIYFMFFALLHELGHLIVGVIKGFKPECLLVFPFGFASTFRNLDYSTNINISTEINKILTCIAGPATNLAIIFFLKMVDFHQENMSIIIYSNVLIAIFNLLPIYPLDGGRILKHIFNLFLDKKKSYTYIQNVSYIFMFIFTFCGSILMYYYKNIILFFIIVYLWTIVIKEDKIIRMKMNYYELIHNIL